MTRWFRHLLPLLTVIVALILQLVPVVGQVQRGRTDGEWREYAGDTYGMKYSPLAQINAENVQSLQVAWRWPSADRAIQATSPMLRASRYEDTPLMANGVLYTVTPLGLIAALDPGTGQTRWVYDPESYKVGKPNNIGFAVRGLAYWTNGNGTQQRLFLGANDAYLISVDAKTGKPDPAFGNQGKVDLTAGIRGAIRATNFSGRRALVAGDVVVVGNSVLDAPAKERPAGYVKAFDVRTGKLLWVFHTVPKKGEFGYETWLEGSAEDNGGANVWAGMAYDPELDYVYLPTSTPSNDYYGGFRPGDNLFAESLVCVEARTGRRVWHFQAIHHGLWDYDFPTHPTLGDLVVNGRRIKAVMQVSKQAFTYVLDRTTGQPVWPIVERPVPQSTVVRERTAPTQPFPTKPPAFDRQDALLKNLIDFTPDLKKRAVEELGKLNLVLGPLYTPPSEAGTLLVPTPMGGANWGGAAFDPETNILYVPSRTTWGVRYARIPIDPHDPNAGATPANRGSRVPTTNNVLVVDGLPMFKGPYSRVTAIDLNKGEHLWMTPIGNGPRTHPLLRDLNLSAIGDPIMGAGPLVTKTLLFVAVTNTWVNGFPEWPSWAKWSDRGWERKLLYVFDKKNGNVIRTIELSGLSAATPMTYMHKGRQYVVMAVGNGADCELVALSLPANRPTEKR